MLRCDVPTEKYQKSFHGAILDAHVSPILTSASFSQHPMHFYLGWLQCYIQRFEGKRPYQALPPFTSVSIYTRIAL